MSNASTLTNITTVEEYEGILALLILLGKLGLKRQEEAIKFTKNEWGFDFERCDYCTSPKCECYCTFDTYDDYIFDEEEKDNGGHKPV